MEVKKCSTCKTSVANTLGSVAFDCPHCGKAKVTRCRHCRETAAMYTCPSCQFTGPN
ncbi:RNA-binding protein [Candidatus Woesearchaeota archaeon]|nr:RNA-binding protein [Candidatus Woesearchaeota archaeon]